MGLRDHENLKKFNLFTEGLLRICSSQNPRHVARSTSLREHSPVVRFYACKKLVKREAGYWNKGHLNDLLVHLQLEQAAAATEIVGNPDVSRNPQMRALANKFLAGSTLFHLRGLIGSQDANDAPRDAFREHNAYARYNACLELSNASSSEPLIAEQLEAAEEIENKPDRAYFPQTVEAALQWLKDHRSVH